VECATDAPVLFNIESKVNPVMRNQTRSAAEFVAAMAKVFLGRGGDVIERITHQSFDVRLYDLYFCCSRPLSFLEMGDIIAEGTM